MGSGSPRDDVLSKTLRRLLPYCPHRAEYVVAYTPRWPTGDPMGHARLAALNEVPWQKRDARRARTCPRPPNVVHGRSLRPNTSPTSSHPVHRRLRRAARRHRTPWLPPNLDAAPLTKRDVPRPFAGRAASATGRLSASREPTPTRLRPRVHGHRHELPSPRDFLSASTSPPRSLLYPLAMDQRHRQPFLTPPPRPAGRLTHQAPHHSPVPNGESHF